MDVSYINRPSQIYASMDPQDCALNAGKQPDSSTPSRYAKKIKHPKRKTSIKSTRLVDLNQARPSNRRLGHGFSVGERPTAIDESGDGESVEQVIAVGEGCLEGGDAVLDVDVGDLLDDRGVLAVDVDDGSTGRGRGGDGELQGLVVGGDGGGDDGQGREDGEGDQVGVGARLGDDDGLVQRREGELAARARQERLRRRDQVRRSPEEAVLLALLPDH